MYPGGGGEREDKRVKERQRPIKIWKTNEQNGGTSDQINVIEKKEKEISELWQVPVQHVYTISQSWKTDGKEK